MSPSEVEFALFFPAVFALHWLLPRRAGWQNAVLLGASLIFYASWNPRLLLLFLLSTALDFAVLRAFARHPLAPDEATAAEQARAAAARRPWLVVGLVSNLGTLAGFKYLGLMTETLGHALSWTGAPDAIASGALARLALPVGLSFYTMARVGVLIDTYYGRIAPVRSPLVWFTFVAFFPQLIAGPIGRGAELFQQYERPRRLEPAAALRALHELATGFVFKVYVAATLGAAWVDPVFAAPGVFPRGAHWQALIGYAAQVFADFAGYSLIALGVARLLGITLPENFNFPYLSTNPMEVWRRWHMSLNRWLFDYVFTPMVTGGGWMRGRVGLGLVVVMLVSGLWHGSTATFVLWGALHGLWLLAHHRYDLHYRSLCRRDRAWVRRRKSAPYLLVGWAATIGFFVITLVPFRATSLAACGAMLRGLVVGGSQAPEPSTIHPLLAVLLVVLHHVGRLPWFERHLVRAALVPAPLRGVALGLVVVFLALFAPVGSGTFIYGRF